MIDCAGLNDRMADVAHGISHWADAEAEHIAKCAACAREWRVIQAGVVLHADVVIDTDRIASAVLARLRAEPAQATTIRRIPWRGTVIGMLAAAASVMIVVYAPRLGGGRVGDISDTTVASLAPELQGMDASQLNIVLQSLEPASADNLPPAPAHLDDLTDAQLESLLHAMGGE